MPIFIIDKLKPKNNGAFKLMDTLDINHKNYNLESYLDSIDKILDDIINNAAGQKLLEMEVVDNWLSWRYVGDEEWNRVLDIDSLGSGGSEIGGNEIYVGKEEPTDQNIKMWIDTSTPIEVDDGEYIAVPTKLSELENNMEFISVTDLKNNLKITKSESGSEIILSYNDFEISRISL